MVNIKDVLAKKEEIRYVTVSAKVNDLHVSTVTDAGVDLTQLIREAFREVYEQADRQNRIAGITPKTNHREVVEKEPERGDFMAKTVERASPVRDKLREDILAMMDHPGQNFYQQEMMDRTSKSQAQVSVVLRMLVDEGLVKEVKEGHAKRYWLSKYPDPSMQEITVGTVNYMS